MILLRRRSSKIRADPPVCRTLTAYTRGVPDSLAAAFIGVLVDNAVWAMGGSGTAAG
jgi:hypothetical protein